MDPGLLVVPAALGVAGLAGWAARAADQRRRCALTAAAAVQGWSYVPRDDREARRPGEPFEGLRRPRARHVLRGSRAGRPVVALELSAQRTTVDGQGARHVQVLRWSVLAVRLPAFLPLVELRPVGALSRLVEPRGLALESSAFNDRYAVRTDDPRLAYDVLSPRALHLLVERPPLALRLLGAEAVSWEAGRLAVPRVLERLETVTALLDLVPPRVWADHGGAA